MDDKPKCYIPLVLTDYYKHFRGDAFVDKRTAVKNILSIYLDYRCLPTEHNDREPDDPAGLGILEIMCMKLIMIPRFTGHIRQIYMRLPEIYTLITEKDKNIVNIMEELFNLEELEAYGL